MADTIGSKSIGKSHRPRVARLRNQMSAGRAGRTGGCTRVGTGCKPTRGVGRVGMRERTAREACARERGGARRLELRGLSDRSSRLMPRKLPLGPRRIPLSKLVLGRGASGRPSVRSPNMPRTGSCDAHTVAGKTSVVKVVSTLRTEPAVNLTCILTAPENQWVFLRLADTRRT